MTHYFDYVLDMVKELRATSSTIEKEDIIANYCSGEKPDAIFARKILLYTYHPTWQFFITSDNLRKKNHLVARENKYKNFFDLLEDLKDRTITGHDAISAVNSFIEHNSDYEDLIHCIIDKDLKTRAGDKIINKAIENHIPEFSVALADKYEPKLVNWKDGWYVSRKIDGARCLAFVYPHLGGIAVEFVSRTGKPFETLGVVEDCIRALNPNLTEAIVFDGELCLVDNAGNEDFQGIMKQLKKKDHTIPNPSFKIFDMITEKEFWSKKGDYNRPYSIRYADLSELIRQFIKHNADSCLSVLPQVKIKDDEHFAEWVTVAGEKKWEGLMLRADEPYKGKRSKDLLKYKNFNDNEYEVVDVEMGPFRYVKNGKETEETMLSCVTIKHKGYDVRVGSGFSIDQRQEFYSDPKKILGKIITVQYFEETKNQDGGISLRFPTFKILHGSSRTV